MNCDLKKTKFAQKAEYLYEGLDGGGGSGIHYSLKI